MQVLPAHEPPVPRLPTARQLEIRTRWKRIKTWLNYSIILFALIQIILTAIQAAEEKSWGLAYWTIIGPVVSSTA